MLEISTPSLLLAAAPKVVFEDTHLLVIEKPAGMLSQEDGTSDACVVTWLRTYLGRAYVGVVHRLDRNTSGLMVYAKRSKSAARLTEALKNGKLQRRYQAIVWGRLQDKTFAWSDKLLKDERTNTVKIVREDSRNPDAKRALLAGRVLAHTASASLCEFTLETGRSHQIRVQAAGRGHPLVGDEKYDPAYRQRAVKFTRPALHSCYLSFPHPMNAEEVLTFVSALPADLENMWSRA